MARYNNEEVYIPKTTPSANDTFLVNDSESFEELETSYNSSSLKKTKTISLGSIVSLAANDLGINVETDIIISIADITLNNNIITIPENAFWRINTIVYSNNLIVETTIVPTASGKNRTDLLVANENNNFDLITGIESEGIAIAPNLPNNTLLVTLIQVTDIGIINVPTPITGLSYVLQAETYPTSVGLVGTEILILNSISSTINVVEHEGQIDSLLSGNEYLRLGKVYYFKNSSSSPLTLKHLGVGGNIKFSFPNDTDFLLQPKEVVSFAYNRVGNTNAKLDFIGRIENEDLVTSVNGQTGAVVIPDAPVQSVNGQTGAVVIPDAPVQSVNGQTGAVVIPDAPVQSVNGQTGVVVIPDAPVQSVNGQTGVVVIPDAPVQSVNGQTGVVVIDAIPLSGTTLGNPVTGNIEIVVPLTDFYNPIISTDSNGNSVAKIVQSDDNFGYLLIDDGQTITVFGDRIIRSTSPLNGNSTSFLFFDHVEGLILLYIANDGSILKRGLSGAQNYSPNITDLDYTQKIYVDTATQWENVSGAIRNKANKQVVIKSVNGEILTLKNILDQTIFRVNDSGRVILANNMQATSFDTNGSFRSLNGLIAFTVESAGNAGFKSNKRINYETDLSATFTDRSLVDKGYTDSKVSLSDKNLSYGQAYLDNFRNRILNDLGTSHPSQSAYTLAELKKNDLLNKASLIITPSATKASKLYAIKPQNGNGDLTVVRNTTATRVNEDGFIESVAANVPRIDYTDGEASILVESQRTNLLTNSEELQNVSASVTVTRDYYNSPSNIINADSYLIKNTNSAHQIFEEPLIGGFSTNEIVTISAFVKKNGNYSSVFLGSRNGQMLAKFDLNTGTVVSTESSVILATITPFQNGFYRITNTYTFTNPIGNGFLYENLIFESTNAYLGDGVSRFGVWGFQLEQGSNATSYIPTVGSTVTRNADVISQTGISNLINSVEGALFADIQFFNGLGNIRAINISNGNNNNRIGFYGHPSVANRIDFVISSGGATSTINYDGVNLTNRNKVLIRYSGTTFTAFVNGIQSASQTFTPFTANFLNRIGFDYGEDILRYEGKINSLQLYKTALTDAECITLTTL
jgi:hypothetical protein